MTSPFAEFQNEPEPKSLLSPIGRLGFAVAFIGCFVAFSFLRNSAVYLGGEGQIFWGLALIAFAWLFIFTIKRLRGIAIGGWWSLCLMIPVVNVAFVIYLMFKRSRLAS